MSNSDIEEIHEVEEEFNIKKMCKEQYEHFLKCMNFEYVKDSNIYLEKLNCEKYQLMLDISDFLIDGTMSNDRVGSNIFKTKINAITKPKKNFPPSFFWE